MKNKYLGLNGICAAMISEYLKTISGLLSIKAFFQPVLNIIFFQNCCNITVEWSHFIPEVFIFAQFSSQILWKI